MECLNATKCARINVTIKVIHFENWNPIYAKNSRRTELKYHLKILQMRIQLKPKNFTDLFILEFFRTANRIWNAGSQVT